MYASSKQLILGDINIEGVEDISLLVNIDGNPSCRSSNYGPWLGLHPLSIAAYRAVPRGRYHKLRQAYVFCLLTSFREIFLVSMF